MGCKRKIEGVVNEKNDANVLAEEAEFEELKKEII